MIRKHDRALVAGDVRLVVHVSGGKRSIRVRDPGGPLAKAFAGFAWFPIDLQYRVIGRFIRDAQPRPIKVLNTCFSRAPSMWAASSVSPS